jgi:hypothetical protein
MSAFLFNVAMKVAIAFLAAIGLCLIGAVTQGRKAFRGFWALAALLVILGVISALPSLLTGERHDGPIHCPRATFGGSC